MPSAYKKLKNPPRGVSNRRAALQWIRSNVKQGKSYQIIIQQIQNSIENFN